MAVKSDWKIFQRSKVSGPLKWRIWKECHIKISQGTTDGVNSGSILVQKCTRTVYRQIYRQCAIDISWIWTISNQSPIWQYLPFVPLHAPSFQRLMYWRGSWGPDSIIGPRSGEVVYQNIFWENAAAQIAGRLLATWSSRLQQQPKYRAMSF